MPASRLVLVLSRSTQQEAELQTWLQSVQDANSPSYRRFLSPEEFGKRFGVDDTDLRSVQNWLTGHGFTVSKVSKGRMAIEFSGSVGQIQATFHTSIHSYRVGGEQHWANASDPQIPRALASVIAGLAALNDFKPRAQFVRGPSGLYNSQTHTITPSYTVGSAYNGYYIFLGPEDAATIYNTPTALNANLTGTAYDGTGVTIGVAGDSNIDLTQNANYRATFGLAPNAPTVIVDGNDPGETGDAIEAYLDTQVAGGIAPNANIILYTAADTSLEPGLLLAIQRALDDNQADILNVSFGECEAQQGAAGNQQILNLWEQAAAQGIAITVSAGDSGSAGCDDQNTETVATQGLAVNGLGSTPYNISVGGTDFDVLYSNFPSSFTEYVNTTNTLPNHRSALQYIPEEPWNDSTYPNTSIAENKPISATSGNTGDDNIVAGGGGISSIYPVPAWQSSFATGAGRNMPDVSFLAGGGFYGAVWGVCTDQDSIGVDCTAGATGNNFNLTGVGGTSASAPAFAGMLALVEQKTGARLGQADYALYDLAKTNYAAVFHDVTSGDNSVNCAESTGGCAANSIGDFFMTGYNASTGYDLASGLGSANAIQLVNNWPVASFIATSSSLQLDGGTGALSITHGQSVQVSASVASAGTTPTGELSLVDNLSPALLPNHESIADFALANGTITGTTNSLPGGTYAVSAHYGGSSTFAASVSNAISVTVAPETSTTAITNVTFTDPATGKPTSTPSYGFSATIDAEPYGNSASAAKPNGAATGVISFQAGTTSLGTAALNAQGVAELRTSLLPGGANSLVASFPGDASFQASTSAPYPITIVPVATSLQAGLQSATPPIWVGVQLSSDSDGAAPTGTVTLMNGSTSVGTAVPIIGYAAARNYFAQGVANLQPTGLPAGTYNLSAVYSGDANYVGSTSAPIAVTLPQAITAVVVSPSASTINLNQSLQVTVTPTPIKGVPLPTGTVTVTPSTNIGTQLSLVNGTVTFTFPANSLFIGTETLTANYSGDTNYALNQGTASVIVTPSGTIKPTVTIAAPTKTTVPSPISFTITVTGPAGDPVPTGYVSGYIGLPGTGLFYVKQLTNGIFTFDNFDVAGGTNTITANYLGDTNYTGGSAAPATVEVFAYPSITFVVSAQTIVVNQPLTVNVSVAPRQTPIATGTVTITGGTAYTSSQVQLIGGAANFTIPANTLQVGEDNIVATYSGDPNYRSATGGTSVGVTAIPATFNLSGTSVTVSPGAITGNASTITLTPSGGFTGSVALTAAVTVSPAGAVDAPTLSFGATTPISITGANNGTATLTISTTPASTSCVAANIRKKAMPWYAEGGAVIACLLLVGIPARWRRVRTILGMLVLVLALASGVISCGGGGGGGGGNGGVGGGGGGGCTEKTDPGTTPGSYTVTVTGTTGATTATTAVNLTVQ
jgi:subtilase family serine protease